MTIKIDHSSGKPELALAPHKSCGSCTLCCKVFDVPWIDKPKPANKLCHHCTEGKGCNIWASVPEKCKEFYCLWRYDHVSGEDWRPDVAGFLMNKESDQHSFVVIADPDRPNDWRREPYYTKLRKAAASVIEQGQLIMIYCGDDAFILVPQGAIEIPRQYRHHHFTLERHHDAKGTHWQVKIGEKIKKESAAA